MFKRGVKYLLAIIGIVAAFTAFPALADVTGAARVVDGDTIWIGDTKIRLHGIDAPEAKQLCYRDNQPWRCGEAATEALRRLIGNNPVRCEDHGSDRYGRMIGRCYVQGDDIEAWMVRNGWALA